MTPANDTDAKRFTDKTSTLLDAAANVITAHKQFLDALRESFGDDDPRVLSFVASFESLTANFEAICQSIVENLVVLHRTDKT
jgi:hypothetical protein